jgi:hypothetical protein
MRNRKYCNKKLTVIYLSFFVSFLLLVSSCGYRVIGSSLLPFNSINIKNVRNNTYEPGLEERLHRALSTEFLNQGIEVRVQGGDVDLEATVTNFQLGAIAAVDEVVKEQEITMQVDVRVTDNGSVTKFTSMQSPIKITFQSTGTVSDSVAHKEMAIDKACREIATEIVSRVIIKYAK